MLKYITTALLIIVPALTNAQILNVERFRLDKDTFNIIMGNIGFGFAARKQQISTLEYDASLNLAYLSKKHAYTTINHTNFQQARQNRIISDGYTHFRFNFFRHKTISYEPFLQLQYDIGRGLYNRNLAGFSFRLNIFKNDPLNHKKIEVGLNSGVMYEYEYWKGPILRYPETIDSLSAKTEFIKSTTNVYTKISLHDNITLFGIVYYQARFEDFFRPRFISDVQLVFNISKHFAFANKFTSTIDAAPIVQDNNFIYALSSNLIIKIN